MVFQGFEFRQFFNTGLVQLLMFWKWLIEASSVFEMVDKSSFSFGNG